MSCILHIETSTEACSVAVSEDGLAVFSKEDLKGPSHAVQLGVFVDEALSFVDSHGMPLDAVAVSCGPGSHGGCGARYEKQNGHAYQFVRAGGRERCGDPRPGPPEYVHADDLKPGAFDRRGYLPNVLRLKVTGIDKRRRNSIIKEQTQKGILALWFMALYWPAASAPEWAGTSPSSI